MDKEISFEQFKEAKRIVDTYWKQQDEKRLAKFREYYDGMTESNLVCNRLENQGMSGSLTIWYFWLSKDGVIPDKDADSYISLIAGQYYFNNARFGHDTYEKAYKAMIQGLKRKGKIK